MSWKPLIVRMPISIVLLTILANILGFIASAVFQSIYVLSTDVLEGDSLGTQLSYSSGAGMFIAYAAVPVSVVLMAVVCTFTSKIGKWHLALALVLGVFLGLGSLGSIYWGIPVFSYVLVTAVSSCLLIMQRQKHLSITGDHRKAAIIAASISGILLLVFTFITINHQQSSNSQHADTTSNDTSETENIAGSSDNVEDRSVDSVQKNGELIASLLKEWNWRVNYDKSTEQRHEDIKTYYSTTFKPNINELLIQRKRVAKWATPLKKVETNSSLYSLIVDDIDGWTLSYSDVSESNKQRLLILAFGCKKPRKCVLDVWSSRTELDNSEDIDRGWVDRASLTLMTDYGNYESTKELIDQISYPFLSPSDFEEKYGTDIKGVRAQ